MKKVILISICFIVTFSIISGFIGFTIGNNQNIENGIEGDSIMQEETAFEEEDGLVENAIIEEETALKIGRALLEEEFPVTFSQKDVPLEAIERDGVWRVQTIVNREPVTENGITKITYGGGLYVDFRKSNGEVLKIGVND